MTFVNSCLGVLCAATLLVTSPVLASSCLRGVNLSGAEFGPLPGKMHVDYEYPSEKTIDHFAKAGMTMIRLPFRWERLQPKLGEALAPAELSALDATIQSAKKAGLAMLLDLHNFGYYGTDRIGSAALDPSAFADVWSRLATHFKSDPTVLFGLMNEPHDISATDWLASANLAIAAIRKTGADNWILVPGTAYTGAHSWIKDLPVGNNSAVMGGVRDPLDRFAYEFHQYLDADFSGSKAECSGAGRALAGIDEVTQWLKHQGKRGFLGEFGASKDPACLAALKTMAGRINAAPKQWIGWAYWSAGDWWPPDYIFTAQPTAAGDTAQMKTLRPLIAGAEGKPTECPAP